MARCFSKVLTNIFHCLDLNGDSLLSRKEFELFHKRSTGDVELGDNIWEVIRGK